jgi:hypothetical protein
MLEAQIKATDDLIARAWSTLRDRSLPEEQLISSAQVEGWRTSAARLIGHMFGEESQQALRFEELYTVRRIERLNHHFDRKDPNWDVMYWIDYFELSKSFLLEVDAMYKIIHANHSTTEVFMGPKYEVKQAGIVGEGNTVVGNTFQQAWAEAGPGIDMEHLAEELSKLRDALKAAPAPGADEGDQDIAIGAVRIAELEARKGDGPAALAALKNAGKWTLVVAEKIGVNLATAALKSAMGL